MPVLDTDPKGSEFYSFPSKPPEGDWAYIVDDFCIGYRRDTLWPFRSTRTDGASDEASIAAFKRQGEKRGEVWGPGEGCGWCPVRLAPDLDYQYSGGQNYVQVWPDMHEAWKANADLHLYVRPQGQGAVVLDCSLVIDLRDMTGTVTTWPIGGSPIAADGFSEDFPEALKAQAGEMKTRILALLAEHMASRDAGKRKIATHHERWYGAERCVTCASVKRQHAPADGHQYVSPRR
jgi:hypothetical protein